MTHTSPTDILAVSPEENKPMTVRPRITIEVHPDLLNAFNQELMKKSLDAGRKVQQREVILKLIAKDMPALKDLVGKELKL